ncbi:MAG TPA: tripartite tricarboxylate transporter substrate binding protein [Burkholderiales bacterium]|nr:tripartite tricarboxylate transporter substrate binding protein [Burkholderiales bacterium]
MKHATRFVVSTLVCAIAATVMTISHAAERTYPTKPIRLLVPYAPGGGNDTMARAIGRKLTEAWGQQVIIDNRPGANGLLAGEIAAKAAPDGYTLFMANIGSHAINPALYPKIPYDPIKDFAPVSLLGTTTNVLVVHPSTPVKTLKELIAYARARDGQVTYGSNGSGSSQHLAGALFGSTFGLKLVHVPYKGTGPMMNDLVGGQIGMCFANMLAVMPHVRAKRLTPIAVSSLTRSSALPDLPAVAEMAPGFEAMSWWGIATTHGSPVAHINALNDTIVKALHSSDMKTFMENLGADPRPTTPREFDAFIKSELTKWAKVVKESGARAD